MTYTSNPIKVQVFQFSSAYGLDGIVMIHDLNYRYLTRMEKVLKCIEIDELLYAIAGASVDVRKAFMRNLSDMVLMLLGENMVGKKVEIREITEVQKHLADLGREFSFSES